MPGEFGDGDAGEPFYRSADSESLLFGRPWNEVPRSMVDQISCLGGRHRRCQWGQTGGQYEERCSCGARRTAPHGRWSGGNPWSAGPRSWDEPPGSS